MQVVTAYKETVRKVTIDGKDFEMMTKALKNSTIRSR
jgi:hypothetical protein